MHRVNEIMSQDVVRIAPTDSIRHAAQLMERYDIGALPCATTTGWWGW